MIKFFLFFDIESKVNKEGKLVYDFVFNPVKCFFYFFALFFIYFVIMNISSIYNSETIMKNIYNISTCILFLLCANSVASFITIVFGMKNLVSYENIGKYLFVVVVIMGITSYFDTETLAIFNKYENVSESFDNYLTKEFKTKLGKTYSKEYLFENYDFETINTYFKEFRMNYNIKHNELEFNKLKLDLNTKF